MMLTGRTPARILTAHRARRGCAGVTLLELAFVLLVVGLFAALAVPAYQDRIERSRVAAAVSDILVISAEIERFRSNNFRLPANLAEIGADGRLDPWNRPYVYLLFDGTNRGQRRKDRNLVPINSEFDLYSVGPDGRSRPPLTARDSLDDVVRARDGSYVGIASGF
jgi:general secretion pathway protein G